jgi:hypothetical protein
MNHNSNSQNINATGSARVSIGSVEQKIVTGQEEVGKRQIVRVLFLAANPAETIRLRLDREIQAIGRALQASGLHDCFELQQSWAVGPAEIQDSLLRYRPDIVHFSGHGEKEGLVLEPSSGLRQLKIENTAVPAPAAPDSVRSLAELFELARGSIRCVVLNACLSEMQAKALAEHVECTMGMSTFIDDTAAIGFAWAFYHALGQGESVRKAFDLACVQAKLAGSGSNGEPRLFANRSDPEALVFIRRQAKGPASS